MPSKGPPRSPSRPPGAGRSPSSSGGGTADPSEAAPLSEPSAGACRVLVEGCEAVYADLDALVAAVRAGEVGADVRVQVPSLDGWRRAADVPALADALVVDDPWAAWDAMEVGDPAERAAAPGGSEPEPAVSATPHEPDSGALPSLPPSALVAAEPESGAAEPVIAELPSEAVQVVRTGKKKGGRFVIEGPKRAKKAPSASAELQGAPLGVGRRTPSAAPPSSGRGRPAASELAASLPSAGLDGDSAPSNVIAFPSPLGPSTLGPHALASLSAAPLLELPALQVPPVIEPRTGPRWGVLGLAAILAFGLVGAVHAWVRHVATQSYRPPVAAVVAAPAPAPSDAPGVDATAETEAAAVADPTALSELTVLDQDLRSRMRTEPGAVREKGDLEAALYVDLSRMGLSELKVDAFVTAWGGKMRDVPQSAEVQVGFRSRPGELDRELAAVGLIVGRYIQAYELDMARFEVLLDAGESGMRRWPIDPAQARNYYIRRSDLPTFLTNMRAEGGR